MTRANQDLATRAQVVAIVAQLRYLGYARRSDRAERLAVCAALLDLDELASTNDLTAGQAGKLVRVLRQYRGRGELAEVAGPVAVSSREPAAAPLEGLAAVALGLALCAGVWRSQRASGEEGVTGCPRRT